MVAKLTEPLEEEDYQEMKVKDSLSSAISELKKAEQGKVKLESIDDFLNELEG